MWCVKCKNDLGNCVCPDIEARLRDLQKPGSHVYIPNCAACGKPRPICKCAAADAEKPAEGANGK